MISEDVLCFGNRFTRNGNDLGVAFKNVHCAKDFGYRLAVKLKPSRCRISIVAAHPVVCPLFSFSLSLCDIAGNRVSEHLHSVSSVHGS